MHLCNTQTILKNFYLPTALCIYKIYYLKMCQVNVCLQIVTVSLVTVYIYIFFCQQIKSINSLIN